MTRRRLALFVVLAVACAIAPAARAALGTSRVASGLAFPVYVTAPPGDPRLFIVEQRGTVRILIGGQLRASYFLDIDSLIVDPSIGDERGLLGLAFHPDFPESAFIFVDYVNNANNTVIARYPISSANSDSVDASQPRILLTITQPYTNHKGGTLLFGPDRYLYIGMGDGGLGGDPENRAQDPNELLGKMLRIDPIGGNPYAIPPDNPYLSDPAYRPEIWAKGFRNPYRWSFDRQTGDLWIGDVGQMLYEEVDFQPASSQGKENYGWRLMEGFHCYNPSSGCRPDTLKLPIYEYDHNGNRCSITGGKVYRGSAIPGLQGAYIFADYCSAQIFVMHFNGSTVTAVEDSTTELAPGGGLSIGSIVCIGEDGYGELYIVDRGNGSTGEVYAVLPTGTDVGPVPKSGLKLGPVQPNPTSGTASFTITLAHAGQLSVSVSDARGRRVAMLASGHSDPGIFPFQWTGTTEAGRRAPAGIYYVRVAFDGSVETRTVTLTR